MGYTVPRSRVTGAWGVPDTRSPAPIFASSEKPSLAEARSLHSGAHREGFIKLDPKISPHCLLDEGYPPPSSPESRAPSGTLVVVRSATVIRMPIPFHSHFDLYDSGIGIPCYGNPFRLRRPVLVAPKVLRGFSSSLLSSSSADGVSSDVATTPEPRLIALGSVSLVHITSTA
ncbi:hypothetical protein DFH07DRAFT_766715 [Mycena maculata]|uniref:Uncharacterized protein n=1 Tax=Mycena maculata TaxID=230809 RepID=A0AAD7K1U6_9AGAR|nr:hypothetical protein DFH07DRAFT_766715 [Mycena maculata]